MIRKTFKKFEVTLCIFLFMLGGTLFVEIVFYSVEKAKRNTINVVNVTINSETVIIRNIRDAFIEVPCQKKTSRQLRSILGPAYNRHYMSVIRPVDFHSSVHNEQDFPYPFEVPTNYAEDLGTKDKVGSQSRKTSRRHTARFGKQLDMTNSKFNFSRSRYATMFVKRGGDFPDLPMPRILPWMCPFSVQWIDMGEDIFPRYMRSVTCGAESCWFDQMSCKERAFVVVILKRKRSVCFADQHVIEELFPKQRTIGISKLPPELQEEWTFEERAANFCCECA